MSSEKQDSQKKVNTSTHRFIQDNWLAKMATLLVLMCFEESICEGRGAGTVCTGKPPPPGKRIGMGRKLATSDKFLNWKDGSEFKVIRESMLERCGT